MLSTIARELADMIGAPIVRLDGINGERGLGLDGQPIPKSEWERTYAEAYRRLEQALLANSSVIFDHVNFTRAARDRVRHFAARHGANIQIILCLGNGCGSTAAVGRESRNEGPE